MNYEARRQAILNEMEDNSLLILYSGEAPHRSADAYHHFEENKNFFYLTGLRRENMVLVMKKVGGSCTTFLFIEKADPTAERWTGKMATVEEAKAVSGIEDVRYVEQFDLQMQRLITGSDIRVCYFDCHRNRLSDLPDYNLAKAQRFAVDFPGITVRNLWLMVTKLRMQKDEDEIAKISQAIEVTRQGLEAVMSTLKPGMKEYQAQANYEHVLYYQGTEGPSFPTIAGSGKNGCMLHYETNRDTCQDGTLLLLDLGTRVDGYCSDITRTYPVNGKFTQRQRAVYEIVLRANKEVAAQAKPGMTTRELNDICKKVLAQGCVELGLIENEDQIGKYYMHGVSHHLGIDVHDVTAEGVKLQKGSVISDEPGLYIDEWEIGIRIEDDLLITGDSCQVLSASIIKEPDEIEAFMASHK